MMIGKDNNIIFKKILFIIPTFNIIGGAGRDRTDDLKLAKLPLSQLSYSPIIKDFMLTLLVKGQAKKYIYFKLISFNLSCR